MAAKQHLERLFDRLGIFWRRVTEGLEIEELWAQFASEARASYGFYSQEVDRFVGPTRQHDDVTCLVLQVD